MPRARTLEELTEAFKRLGVEQPEDWAASEVDEGINQLGRAAFLTAAWRDVVSERDDTWIGRALLQDPNQQFGLSASLQRALDVGVDKGDLAFIVRSMQGELLQAIACLLDDQYDLPVHFALFEVDQATGKPISPIEGLHESVLETDPEGLELQSIRGGAIST